MGWRLAGFFSHLARFAYGCLNVPYGCTKIKIFVSTYSNTSKVLPKKFWSHYHEYFLKKLILNFGRAQKPQSNQLWSKNHIHWYEGTKFSQKNFFTKIFVFLREKFFSKHFLFFINLFFRPLGIFSYYKHTSISFRIKATAASIGVHID